MSFLRRHTHSEAKVDAAERKPARSRWAGVWEILEMPGVPLTLNLWDMVPTARVAQAIEDLPYLLRVLNILVAYRHICVQYIAGELLLNVFLPNASLWLSGYLLSTLAAAPQLHSGIIVLALLAWNVLPMVELLLRAAKMACQRFLEEKVQRHFILHMINVRARLDLVTFQDRLVEAQLNSADPNLGAEYAHEEQTKAWHLLWALLRTIMLIISLLCSVSLSTTMLQHHPSIIPLAVAAFSKPILNTVTLLAGKKEQDSIWVAVCKGKRYMRFRGLRASLSSPTLRKEIVVGDLGHYIAEECASLASELKDAVLIGYSNFARYSELDMSTPEGLAFVLFDQLPLTVLALLVLCSPGKVAMFLGSFAVIQQAVRRFDDAMYSLMYSGMDVMTGLAALKRQYELVNLSNKIEDGTRSFPDDDGKGISIEFENVSLTYAADSSDAEESRVGPALKNLSFKIGRNQFAVIVGVNGSGKSTIVKLLARLYDPDEGRILINGVDIKRIRLSELRSKLAVLFQDFAFFALTIRENIALGAPGHADADAAIDDAVKLAGIDFVHKFESYLEHPAPVEQSPRLATLPDGPLHEAARASEAQTTDLSGGQKQKMALARTLLRATHAGVLILDEPTAALDPVAESSLFRTLRNIGRDKTVIVSSHRFGDLTKHADVIIHVKEGTIVEQGTHEQLLVKDGAYGEMWYQQVRAFASSSTARM